MTVVSSLFPRLRTKDYIINSTLRVYGSKHNWWNYIYYENEDDRLNKKLYTHIGGRHPPDEFLNRRFTRCDLCDKTCRTADGKVKGTVLIIHCSQVTSLILAVNDDDPISEELKLPTSNTYSKMSCLLRCVVNTLLCACKRLKYVYDVRAYTHKTCLWMYRCISTCIPRTKIQKEWSFPPQCIARRD